MKKRSHKKYSKRVGHKSRRNKVGGSCLIESITNAIGLTTPQPVMPLQPVMQQPVMQQPVIQQPVIQENPYFNGKINKKKVNMIKIVGGKRTRKYKK